MTRPVQRFVPLVLAVVFALPVACGQRDGPGDPHPWFDLPFNQIQVIGTHNSYKLAIQPELLAIVDEAAGHGESWDYQHISIYDQLNLGVRNLEIDVYWDPRGGLYADPLGNRMLRERGVEPWPIDAEGLSSSGFKVVHDADFDFRTHHVRLEDTLFWAAGWGMENPRHVPIVVTVNTKQSKRDIEGSVEPGQFDARTMRRLSDTIRESFGDQLLTPDDLRGDAPSVRDAVMTSGWPTLRQAAAKFIFVLDERGAARDAYLEAFPGLEGGVFFPLSPPEDPTAAIMVVNDPVRDEQRIRELVEAGFIVRTRADAGTHEARAESFERFEAAKRSGAQIITTDYPIPDRRVSDRYVIRFEHGHFEQRNPVTAPPRPRLMD
jgi:hypothetical protein